MDEELELLAKLEAEYYHKLEKLEKELVNKPERDRYDAICRLGCIICGAPSCVHHLTGHKYRGMGKKASWQFTIPLCPTHHQHGGYGVAFHAGQKEFEKNFGTQEELLERTNAMLSGS